MFLGRKVTVTEGPRDPKEDMFPVGPASVCIEGPPQSQCYTAPENFGNDPSVTVVELRKDEPALLFQAAIGGVSGWAVRFALLGPGEGKALDDLFLSNTTVSNQNQHAFWNEPSISPSLIFVTAGYVPGPDEGHYGAHRFIVSTFVRNSTETMGESYFLCDQYMTLHMYDIDAKEDVLASEKPEILARLKRVVEFERAHPPR